VAAVVTVTSDGITSLLSGTWGSGLLHTVRAAGRLGCGCLGTPTFITIPPCSLGLAAIVLRYIFDVTPAASFALIVFSKFARTLFTFGMLVVGL